MQHPTQPKKRIQANKKLTTPLRTAHRAAKQVLLSLTAAVLVACGGGGGSASQEVPNANNLAPANVKLLEVSSAALGQVTASWLPATDDATPVANLTYQLHASTDAAFTPSASTKVFEGKEVYQAMVSSGLTAGSKYTFKLLVVDGQGASASSEGLGATVSDTAVTLNVGVKVAALQDTQVASVSGNQMTLQAGVTNVQVGQFVASAGNDTSNGYLKKVESVTTSNGQTVLQTSNAAISEVISDVNVSSTFKLASVPKDITAAAQQAGLVRKTGTAQSPVNEFAWKQSGYRYQTGVSTSASSAQGLPASWGQAMQAGLTQGRLVAKSGSWGKLELPEYIVVKEGETANFNIHGYITDTTAGFDGQPRQICKLELGDVSGTGKDAQIAKLDFTIASPSGNHWVDFRHTHLTYPTTLKVGSGAENVNPYKVDVKLQIEEKDEGCADQKWDETVTQTLRIYVINDKTVLDEEESVEKTFSGSAGLSVKNNIKLNFQPTLSFDKTISGAKLTYARIQLDAAPLITQTLTIDAKANGEMNKTLELIKPRKFYKVYVAGGVPIVITGTYTLNMNISGTVDGALNATEVLSIGYDQLSYGLEYKDKDYKLIKDVQPTYRVNLGGEGKAQANLVIKLEPGLELTAYELLTGKVVLQPYLDAKAGIQGKVQMDTEVDFNALQLNMAADADYRITQGEIGGGVKLKLGADLSVWEKTVYAWPDKNDKSKLQEYDLVKHTVFWGIPNMPPASQTTNKNPTDTRAIAVKATATTVPNPLKTLFPSMDDTFVTWAKWTDARIVPQLSVDASSYSILADGAGTDTAWVVFNKPGTYAVRQGGYSSLGTWARQYTETTIEIKDDNSNSIPDWWEQRYALTGSGTTIAAADTDGDGLTNLEEWELGSDPRVEAGATVVTSVTPSTVTEGQKTVFTIKGANLAADIEVKPSFGTCHTPYAITATQVKVVCAVIASSNGAATVMDVRKAGASAALYKRTLALTGNLNCATDQIDQGGVCVSYGQMSRDIEAPSVLQEVVFKIELWWEGVKSVLWTFSDRATALAKDVAETLSTSFATQGETTVTAIYKDVNGNTLGSTSVKVQVGPALVATTATVTDVIDDSVSPNVSVAGGASTTDVSPVVKGTISAALSTCPPVTQCYSVQVFENDETLGSATVAADGTWTYTTTYATGTHNITAAVVRWDGVRGSQSAVRSFTVTGATSTSKLPHTGITASQCYAAGSNTLELCTGAGPQALNAQQDGHRAAFNAMSYSKVGFSGEALPDNASSWCAVKDNVTGLLWQNHQGTPATFTNWGDNRAGDASKYAADNATLCGQRGWRLPTVDELQSIVDYSKPYPGPTVNINWFSNTPGYSYYWSSSPNVGNSGYAWYVLFDNGSVGYNSRGSSVHVRLVRASP